MPLVRFSLGEKASHFAHAVERGFSRCQKARPVMHPSGSPSSETCCSGFWYHEPCQIERSQVGRNQAELFQAASYHGEQSRSRVLENQMPGNQFRHLHWLSASQRHYQRNFRREDTHNTTQSPERPALVVSSSVSSPVIFEENESDCHAVHAGNDICGKNPNSTAAISNRPL